MLAKRSIEKEQVKEYEQDICVENLKKQLSFVSQEKGRDWIFEDGSNYVRTVIFFYRIEDTF